MRMRYRKVEPREALFPDVEEYHGGMDMKKHAHLIVLILAAGVLAATLVWSDQSLPVPGYFPLQTGNQWTYACSSSLPAPEKLVVFVDQSRQDSASGMRWYRLNNFNGSQHWVRQDRSGNVWERRSSLWYRLAAAEGSSWRMHLNPAWSGDAIPCVDGSRLTIVSREELVAIPAGTFETVHIAFQSSDCFDAGITDEWYAEGVGMVKRAETSLIGAVVMELEEAVIDGRIIGGDTAGESLVAATVRTGQPEYWEDHMPIIGPGIRQAPEIRIECTVNPISGTDTILTFSDFNVWDVRILNPRGEVVWSNPKILAPSPIGGVDHPIPGAGESAVFGASLAYGSEPGTYRVIAQLLAAESPPPAAETTFEYGWAY